MEKEEIKLKWYKNKYTWIFIVIMLAAIALRFYYFQVTANEPSWWDSADYLSQAKSYAGIMPYDMSFQRLPGYALFMSSFFAAGIQSEELIRFLSCFIPSIIMLLLMYWAIKEMYPDRRIALISVAIMTVLWESLFYSNRFQTENFGLIFQFGSFLCLYTFLKTKRIAFLASMAAMAILSVLFRPAQLLFFPAIAIFLAIVCWKNHRKWVIGAVTGGSALFVGLLALAPSFKALLSSYMLTDSPIAWNSIAVFWGMYETSVIPGLPPILLYAFVFGLFIAVIQLFTAKGTSEIEQQDRNADIFNLLLIGTIMASFMFIIRAPAFEYRWFFPLITGMLVFTAKGILIIADIFSMLIVKGKTGKFLAAGFILFIMAAGMYAQIEHADVIIKQKIHSYEDVKSAALWIKENSNQNDVIFSISKPQTAYYSERKVMSYSLINNEAGFDQYILQNNPRWITVSIFEPHPQWIFNWLLKNNETIFPAAAYFTDASQKQTTLVIYGFYKDLQSPPVKNAEICTDESDTCKV